MSANTTLQWRSVVQRLIKTEMSRRDVRYQELSERLAAAGTQQSADNLRNRVNKGILGADLLLQILSALQVKNLSMQELEEIFTDVSSR